MSLSNFNIEPHNVSLPILCITIGTMLRSSHIVKMQTRKRHPFLPRGILGNPISCSHWVAAKVKEKSLLHSLLLGIKTLEMQTMFWRYTWNDLYGASDLISVSKMWNSKTRLELLCENWILNAWLARTQVSEYCWGILVAVTMVTDAAAGFQ